MTSNRRCSILLFSRLPWVTQNEFYSRRQRKLRAKLFILIIKIRNEKQMLLAAYRCSNERARVGNPRCSILLFTKNEQQRQDMHKRQDMKQRLVISFFK